MTPLELKCRDKATIQCVLRDYMTDELAMELSEKVFQMLPLTLYRVQIDNLQQERDRYKAALEEIAAYDKNSPHGEGICHYGCDSPWLAKTALGIVCDVPNEIGDC